MCCRKEHRPVCCQQRDPSNVKSITAQAELFDSISHDWADTRFPGVYSVFLRNMPRDLLRSCLYVGFAADWVAEYSRDKLLTWETQSWPEQSCLGLKGNTYRETKSHAGQHYPQYTYVLTKGLVSQGRSCLVWRWWKAHYVLWGTAHYLMFLMLV